MPTYDYHCDKCGNFEFVQKITDDALKTCPTCGGAVKRLVSAAAFHLKGSGWYKTDYASGSSGSSSSSSSSTSSSDSDGAKTETKSDTKSNETKSETKLESKPCGGGCSCS